MTKQHSGQLNKQSENAYRVTQKGSWSPVSKITSGTELTAKSNFSLESCTELKQAMIACHEINQASNLDSIDTLFQKNVKMKEYINVICATIQEQMSAWEAEREEKEMAEQLDIYEDETESPVPETTDHLLLTINDQQQNLNEEQREKAQM